jgi:hypothetical protein
MAPAAFFSNDQAAAQDCLSLAAATVRRLLIILSAFHVFYRLAAAGRAERNATYDCL